MTAYNFRWDDVVGPPQDQLVRALASNKENSEWLVTSDATTPEAGFSRLEAEVLTGLTDGLAWSSGFERREDEPLGVVDHGDLTDNLIYRSEVPTVADWLLVNKGFARREDEPVGALDTLLVTAFQLRHDDGLTVADDVQPWGTAWGTRHLVEGPLTVAEAFSATAGLTRRRDETPSLTEGLAKVLEFARRNADTLIATDTLTEEDVITITHHDALTVQENAWKTHQDQRHDEPVAVAETTLVQAVYQRSHGDTLTFTEANTGLPSYQRVQAETLNAVDGLAEVVTYQRREDEAAAVGDGVVAAVAYQRRQNEALTVASTLADPEVSIVESYVYIRHNPTFPAVAISPHDWEKGAQTGTGSAVVTLERGVETKLIASAFEGWIGSSKHELGRMMMRSGATFHEDYFVRGMRRQLGPTQVFNYTTFDSPWVTWMLHRAKTGVVDDTDPTLASSGVLAVNFTNVLVKLNFTGGTNPWATITPWFRDVGAKARGPWVRGTAIEDVENNTQVPVEVLNREVWLQLTSFNSNPSETAIYVSGKGA